MVIQPELASFLTRARQAGKSVVLATGVFDLFHIEHRQFLDKAKASGDYLIVGVETDARVKEIKGDDRPFQPEAQRLKQVQVYPAVDRAFLLPAEFSTQEHFDQFMSMIRPTIYAVSSNTPHQENKALLAKKYRGRLVVVHQHNPEVSTSQLLSNPQA